MTVISEVLLSRGQAGKIKPKVPACPRARRKVEKLVSSCHREQSRRCLVSLFGFRHKFPSLRLRQLSEVEIHKLLFLSWRLQSGNLLNDKGQNLYSILASCRRNWGGIAFANIYEVPKNENPQPAMGKLVGEIMIDFAFIRKYPIVNYNGYSSKAQSTVLK